MEADSREGSDRTVVVSGVPDVLPASRMSDKLTIHFQSCRRSRGGDVEAVKYPTNMDGVAFITFDQAEDAERVVRKERQIMTDNEFPGEYLLTVFPFTPDVFLYVANATVDLSVFGRDQLPLVQSLGSAHRSLRFRPLTQQMKATVEGPFAAVQVLRQDLIRRASRLKPQVSAQTAAVKLRETPLNPMVISHHEGVSCSKAEPGPASSNGLSAPLQTTGEAAQKASSRPKVHGSLSVGSFCNTRGCEEAEQRDRSRLEMPTEYRTERDRIQVLNQGVGSPLSGLDRLLAEEISAKQPESEKRSRPDRNPAAEIRGESDSLKESDQSSSAFTANILQTRVKDVSTSDRDELSAIRLQHQETACIWLDSYTYRYIERFHKKEFDRCLRGLIASVEHLGGDLTRILLAERPTSKTPSRIQQASDDLQSLAEYWMSMLRVHCIEHGDKRRLVQLCDDANVWFTNVLYVLEDAGVKVVGPSVASHLFCMRVEDKLKGTLRL